MAKRLTKQQRDFVNFFLGKCNGNATRAAEMAGYSDPVANASRIRNHPEVAAEIERLLEAEAMPLKEALKRLADQARGPGAYLLVAQNGNLGVDGPALLEDGMGHLVKGVKETKWGQEIEFTDAQAALRDVLRHHGAFNDKLEVTVNEFDGLADAELEQIARTGRVGTARTGGAGASETEA